MSLSTSDSVSNLFLLASRDALQRSLRTGEDWDRYKEIIAEANTRFADEERAFALGFHQRMAEAREMILREEYAVRLDQPLPKDALKYSDARTLDRKAAERVYRDHERRRAVIRKDERDQYADLIDEIRARDAPARDAEPSKTRSHARSRPDRDI